QLEGLTDEATIGQLAGIRYELDGQGRIKIESKEQARARGVASPDRAEALMLALCRPPQRIEFYSVRDLPLLNQQGQSPSSAIHYEDDDLDNPRNRALQMRRHRPSIDAILRRRRFAGY